MKKMSKEYKKGYLAACRKIASIDRKSFSWHLLTFGENGATALDYANWAKIKMLFKNITYK